MPRYDERQVLDVDRRKGWYGCGGHDGLAMRQRLLRVVGVSGALGSCARGCRGESLSKGKLRVRSGDTVKTEKERSVESEEERKTSTLSHTLCAVQMYAHVSRRAYTPFHAIPCKVKEATLSTHLASRDHVICCYHRITGSRGREGESTRHIPLSSSFISFYHLTPNHAERR